MSSDCQKKVSAENQAIYQKALKANQLIHNLLGTCINQYGTLKYPDKFIDEFDQVNTEINIKSNESAEILVRKGECEETLLVTIRTDEIYLVACIFECITKVLMYQPGWKCKFVKEMLPR